ncbi:MAG TPA: alpha/beta hydrolase [Hansschlegelia sp.]
MTSHVSGRAHLLRFFMRHAIKTRMHATPDIERIRASMERVARFAPDRPKGVTRRTTVISGVAAEWSAPVATSTDRRILYLHGGGFVSGSPRTHRGIAGRLARGVAARVVVPDYRLAPEHPFPAALDDAAAVYRALLDHGVPPARIAVVGDSAGGNLTFALLLKLKAEGAPMPAAAVGMSPFVDMTGSGESLLTNAALDPLLHAAGFPSVVSAYAPGLDPANPLLSPLFGDLAGLPPCLIQCGSDEILLDDAVRLQRALEAAGVSAELEVWTQMPHVWQVFARLIPEAKTAIDRISQFLRARLGEGEHMGKAA